MLSRVGKGVKSPYSTAGFGELLKHMKHMNADTTYEVKRTPSASPNSCTSTHQAR